MKPFKLFSIGCKIVFLSQISAFFNSVAQLCNEKKSKSEPKTLIFRFNQKSLNDFNINFIQKYNYTDILQYYFKFAAQIKKTKEWKMEYMLNSIRQRVRF